MIIIFIGDSLLLSVLPMMLRLCLAAVSDCWCLSLDDADGEAQCFKVWVLTLLPSWKYLQNIFAGWCRPWSQYINTDWSRCLTPAFTTLIIFKYCFEILFQLSQHSTFLYTNNFTNVWNGFWFISFWNM